MENSQSIWIMYIFVFSLNFLTAERHLFLGAAKLNQHKGILTSKFASKDMLLWKRCSSFAAIEDKMLSIAFRLMWFDQGRHPEKARMGATMGGHLL